VEHLETSEQLSVYFSTLNKVCLCLCLPVDEEPPVFTYCPSDIVMDNLTSPSVRVYWQRPTVTDNSGVSPTVSSSRQSGEISAVPGSYEVLYNAIDASGNKATCSFRITLKRKYEASLFEAPCKYALQ